MKDKIKAFLWHLSVSLLIALLAMLVVYGVWNPDPLYKATGITDIFLLMLAIDIILGPILTLIVFKKGKKTLKFDLCVIALLQMSALMFGLYKVYEGRPAWIVYSVDRFDLVRVNELDLRKINEAQPEYQKVGMMGPKYIAAIIPVNDLETKNAILFEEIGSGIAPSQRPELYKPLKEVQPIITQKMQNLSLLDKHNPPTQVKQILGKYPHAAGYLPLKANKVDMSVLVDKEGNVIKIVDLRPWQ